MSKPCACGCGERARPGRRFQIGHSFETARLWRGKGKPDIRKMKNKDGTTVRYTDDGRVETPTPFQEKEPAVVWSPDPSDWFRAEVVKCHAGNATFARLSRGEQLYIHGKLFDYPLTHTPGLVVSVRIEPSDKGAKYRALEAVADFDPDAEEVAVVTKWNGHFGVMIRGCGCHLLASVREETELQPGETVIVSGFRSDGNPEHRTLATQIRKTGGEAQ